MRLFQESKIQRIREEEQEHLRAFVSLLTAMGHRGEGERISRLIEQIDRPFLLVVVGEYNSGKSSFINALLGQEILAVKSIPTTDRIIRLKYGVVEEEQVIEEDNVEAAFPIELLREINIVDTPGTNSIIRHHQRITENYIHQSELILFVTSTDRPFSESERRFLELIKGRWDRKVLFILNKADLKSATELAEITEFLEKNIYKTLDFEPRIFHVSAKLALAGKREGKSAWIEESGIGEIERFLFHTLDQSDRLYLKLVSPLKVAHKLESDLIHDLEEQLASLNEQIRDLEEQSATIRRRSREMEAFFSKYLAEIETVMFRFEKRILDFLDRAMTLSHLVQIRGNVKEIEKEFKEEVIGKANTMEAIEEIINDAIDYVIRNNKELWEEAVLTLARYQEDRPETVRRLPQLHEMASDKNEIFRTLRDSTDKSLRKFDVSEERERLREEITQSLKQLVTLEGVALGAGIAVILSTIAFVDISGILLGSLAAISGFFVIPQRRRKAKRDVEAKIERIEDELQDILSRHLQRTLSRLNEEIERRLEDARRKCDTRRDLVLERKGELEALLKANRNLIHRLESLTVS